MKTMKTHAMQFGNWKLSEQEIAYTGDSSNRFNIPKDELTKTTNTASGTVVYAWILSATDEEWLTENDLYDLNYIFVYAAAKFGSDFKYEIFDDTLGEQFDQFEEEDEV